MDYTNLYDLHYNYNAEKKLGSATKTEVNKFEVLRIAQNIGIKIPKSILTNSKSNSLSFIMIAVVKLSLNYIICFYVM